MLGSGSDKTGPKKIFLLLGKKAERNSVLGIWDGMEDNNAFAKERSPGITELGAKRHP